MSSDLRRQKIIDAAITVLLEKGVAGSRMNDFVDASGLSKGGVYHHFDSKEELLIGVLSSFIDRIVGSIDMAINPEQSAYQQLQALLQNHEDIQIEMGQYNRLFLDFFAQAPFLPRFHKLMRQQYDLFHNQLTELLRLGIQQGEFAKTTDPDAMACGIRGY
jgi:AcrR family transcriptional regulator